MTLKDLWGMVNRIAVDSPTETLNRCKVAERYITNVDCPELMVEDWKGNYPFDEMIESIHYIAHEARQRMN